VNIRTMAENAKVVSRDGTVIAFSRLGHGPPLILVDGAFCFRDNGPTPQLAPLLARRFTVYVYDRRGRGESGDTSPYAIEREVEDLSVLLDAAGGSAFVFGMSSGAGIVLRAVENGMPVRKIALYEPPFISDKDGQPRQLEGQQAELERLVADGNRSEAVMYMMTEVFGAPRAFIQAMRILKRTVWKKNESVAHTLPRDLAILNDWSVLKAGSSIKIPTLIIGGAKSSVELQLAITTVGESVPNSRRQMLGGQSHNVSMKVLAPALEEFYLSK